MELAVAAPRPDAPLDQLDRSCVSSALQAYVRNDTHLRHRAVPVSEAIITSMRPVRGGDVTHTFFAGGKGCVGSGTANAVMLLYGLDLICKDQSLHLLTNQIERARQDSFPLFFDVDLRAVRMQRQVAALHSAFFALVVREVRRFFPTAASPSLLCVVCARPPLAHSGGCKYGYHLHFPHLRVDQRRALYVREAVVAAFRRTYGERVESGENSWGDVFDVTVYKGSRGLRNIGSYKMKRADRSTTNELHGRAWTQCDDSGNPVTYWPTAAVGADGTDRDLQAVIDEVFPVSAETGVRGPAALYHRRELREQIDSASLLSYLHGLMRLLNLTRVRVDGPLTAGFELYPGAPAPNKLGSRLSCSTQHANAAPRPRGAATYTQVTRDLSRSHELVQRHLRGVTDGSGRPFWPNIEVAQLFVRRGGRCRGPAQQQMLVAVRGEGSNFCLNLRSREHGRCRGRDHSSNRIYFWLGSAAPYLSQRCHSPHEPHARHFATAAQPAMCCTRFRSDAVAPAPLHGAEPSAELLQLLYDLVHFDGAPRRTEAKRKRSEDLTEFL